MLSRKRVLLVDVARFVVLTLALSALFAALIIRAGHITSGRSLFTRGLMWSPGVAALILLRRDGRSWREIGWRWTGRWEWICYTAVLSGGLLVYGGAWLSGFMLFPDHASVESIAADFGRRSLPTSVIVAGYSILMLTLGMLPAVMNALGEEIGWRGYLVPRLATEYRFTATALISGAIWAAWHYPMFLVNDYYRGGELWYSIACFTMLILAASVICTWLRLKSGSIWPAVMVHATNNLLVQDVMRPLAGTGHLSRYAVDQFGGMLPVLAVIVAIFAWRHRGDLDSRGREASDAHAATVLGLQEVA